MLRSMTMPALAIGLAATVFAGCTGHSTARVAGGNPSTTMPNPAEQACLRDVTRTTNNPDVVLLGSTFSQAGTEVIVGVGPQRARWQCIAYDDGTTAGIQSLTDEGAL